MSTGVRVQPWVDQNRSTAAGSGSPGSRAGTSRRTSTGSGRCRPRARPRPGVRRGRARPARARSRARRSRPSGRARRRPTRRAAAAPGRCPGGTVTDASRRVRRRASADQVGMRLDPGHRRRGRRRTAAGGSRCRSRGRARRGPPSRPARPSRTRAGRRGRRRGSRPRRSRCGARCSGWGECPRAGCESGQIRTRPRGVCTCAAMIPGVPLGATHSTLTSSSGASTVSPSHSLTRCGSPAISRQAREKRAVGAVARVQLGRAPPTAMKNGSCGSAIRPLTPICFQRSSVPSGRCRLPTTASRPSRLLDHG